MPFNKLPSDVLDQLVSGVEPRIASAGEELICPDKIPDGIFILDYGCLEVAERPKTRKASGAQEPDTSATGRAHS